MKYFSIAIFLTSSVLSMSGMEKDAFIPAVYKADQVLLDDIVRKEILKRIDQKKIKKGVKAYIRAHHKGCTKEEEHEYMQKIREKAIENKVKKSILSYVRQDLSAIEKDGGVILGESGHWQAVVDKINFGILVFDGQGKLICAGEENKNKQ